MVLSEVPSTHISRNSIVEGLPNHSKGPGHAQNVDGEAKSPSIRHPSSIQSMLRNSTETGDIGPFSIETDELAPSVRCESSKLPKRPSLYARSQAGSLHGSNNGENRHNSMQSDQSTTASGVISLYQSESQKSFRRSSRGLGYHYVRTYAAPYKSQISHKIAHQRSYASLRPQAHGDPRSIRPRSPYAYPTRLKRPGYRPSSPSLSDYHGSASKTSLNRDLSFRTASPASLYASRRIPGAWQSDASRSTPSLPGSRIPTARYQNAHQWSQQLSLTPISHPDIYMTPVGGDEPGNTTVERIRAPSRSPSPSPLYYDYTEAFEEFDYYRSASSAVSLVEPMIREDSPNPDVCHELDVGPPTRIITDLPIGNIYDDVNNGTASPERTAKASQAEGPRAVDTLPFDSELWSPKARSQSLKRGLSKAEIDQQDAAQKIRSKADDLAEHRVTSSVGSHKRRRSSKSNVLAAMADISPNSKAPSRASSESRYSQGSSFFGTEQDLNVPLVTGPKIHAGASSTSKPKWNLPPMEPKRRDSNTGTNRGSSPHLMHATSVDGIVDTKQMRIFAPIPERPRSAHSHTAQLSRILSIHDDLDTMLTRLSASEKSKGPAGQDRTAEEDDRQESVLRRNSSQLFDFSRQDVNPMITAVTSLHTRQEMESEFSVQDGVRQTLSQRIKHSNLKKQPSGVKYSGDTAIVGDTHGPRLAYRTSSMRDQHLSDSFQSNNLEVSVGTSLLENYQIYPVPPRISSMRKIAVSNPNPPMTLIEEPTQNTPVTSNSSQVNEVGNSVNEVVTRPQTMKDLPPLPRKLSLRSFPPPSTLEPAPLPFAFTPLILVESKSESILQPDPTTLIPTLKNEIAENVAGQTVPAKPEADTPSDGRKSSASPSGSRPWNLEESYPWTNLRTDIDFTMPQRASEEPVRKAPRFKLRLTRASSSTSGTVKITKQPSTPRASQGRRIVTPIDLFRNGSTVHKKRPPLPAFENSSHSTMILTRFMDVFSSPANQANSAPTITLEPPSPGLGLGDVRSFFSDDSSQHRDNKGSLRKRLSQLKAIAHKATLSDDARGSDRGHTSLTMRKSRSSSRASIQDARKIDGMLSSKFAKRSLGQKLKEWWQREKGKLRTKMMGGHKIDRSDSTDPC